MAKIVRLPKIHGSLALDRPSFRVDDEELRTTARLAQENLLRLQSPEGWWAGELFVDSTLCSDYVLYMHWRGKVDPALQEKCVRHIRKRQLDDGGWNIYHGGPSEINACVKAYFALKLAGHSPQAPVDERGPRDDPAPGRHPALQHVLSKLYFALMGVFPWKYLPTIPAEMVLFPGLGVFQHLPDVELVAGDAHPALDHQPLQAHAHPAAGQAAPRVVPLRHGGHGFLAAAFGAVLHVAQLLPALRRAMLKWLEKTGFRPLRARALKMAEAWMVERMGEGSDGLAAIFPAMLNAFIALEVLGYEEDHPGFPEGEGRFRGSVRPRSRRFPHRAVLFAGVGHGDQRHRAGRERPGPGAPGVAQGGRVAVFQGSPPAGRLDQAEPGARGERLGVRVQQRLLSRHRRHRDGAHGAAADLARRTRRRPTRRSSARSIGR